MVRTFRAPHRCQELPVDSQDRPDLLEQTSAFVNKFLEKVDRNEIPAWAEASEQSTHQNGSRNNGVTTCNSNLTETETNGHITNDQSIIKNGTHIICTLSQGRWLLRHLNL